MSTLGRARDRRDQGPLDLGAGRVAARVQHPPPAVGGLATECESAGLRRRRSKRVPIERSQSTASGPPVDQLADGLRIAEPGAGEEGVCLVQLDRVVRADRRGEPALRPARVALAQLALGQQRDPHGLRQPTG